MMATLTTAQMVRLVPLAGWVLIQPRAVVSEVTKAGIIKVDQSGEKPQTGVVLDVGPDVPLSIASGMLVLYGKFAGVEVDLGDYEAVLLDVKDLLAVVELRDVELEDEAVEADDPAEPLIAVAAR